MRTIRYTNQFKRDYKREKSGKSRHHAKNLDDSLMEVVHLLAADTPTRRHADTPLPASKRDHRLGGEWSDHRDCHIRPDLVLIYRKPDAANLDLVRLGSHSELGL